MTLIRKIFTLAAMGLSGCGLCGNQILQEENSPDGSTIATVMIRDCGATTSEFSQVRLKSKYRWLGFDERVVLSLKYIHQDLHVSWAGPGMIEITCGKCFGENIMDLKNRWRDVRIIVNRSAEKSNLRNPESGLSQSSHREATTQITSMRTLNTSFNR